MLASWTLSALILVPAAPAPLDPGARMAWKFEKGRPFYQKMVTQTDQTMKVGGTEVKQAQKQTLVCRWVPLKQLPDRSWVIQMKIHAVAMDLDIGGNKISYDSSGPRADNPLSEFFSSLLGSEFTVTVNRNHRVTRVEGGRAFIDKLGKANPQVGQLLQQILSEDAFKEMAEPVFAYLPNRAVKKGAKWAEERSLSMGPMGTFATLSQYTYEGPALKGARLEKIGVRTKLTYRPPAPGAAGGALPFSIKRADWTTAEGAGTIYFSPVRGRTERSEMTARMKGRLTIETGGVETEVELDQTQATTTTLSDEAPGAKGK
jgi:hypothetical protein